VTSVINPQISGPNSGLPGPVPNVRYLLVSDIGSDTSSWGTIIGSQTGQSTAPETQQATTLVPGVKYQIATIGTTDFRNYGAPANTIGTQFTMNNVQPEGTGTVFTVVEAQANDILQFNADIMTWFIAFDSSVYPDGLEYVTNLTTEIQYRWAATPADSVQPGLPAQWMKSYEGYYNEGDYSIVI
jgi:hypothetical protein